MLLIFPAQLDKVIESWVNWWQTWCPTHQKKSKVCVCIPKLTITYTHTNYLLKYGTRPFTYCSDYNTIPSTFGMILIPWIFQLLANVYAKNIFCGADCFGRVRAVAKRQADRLENSQHIDIIIMWFKKLKKVKTLHNQCALPRSYLDPVR